jgi:hypothetical protein
MAWLTTEWVALPKEANDGREGDEIRQHGALPQIAVHKLRQAYRIK